MKEGDADVPLLGTSIDQPQALQLAIAVPDAQIAGKVERRRKSLGGVFGPAASSRPPPGQRLHVGKVYDVMFAQMCVCVWRFVVPCVPPLSVLSMDVAW